MTFCKGKTKGPGTSPEETVDTLFHGKLALQIMFMEQNKKYVEKIAQIAKMIKPDEVELNTPLRPSAVKPLSKKELYRLKKYFNGLPTITAYDTPKKAVEPFDRITTITRHGRYPVESA